MTIRNRAIRATLAVALLTGIASLDAAAQAYPNHSIRMIVPYPAGGSVDVLGRAVADKLSASLGQPVVPDNRAGRERLDRAPGSRHRRARRLHDRHVGHFPARVRRRTRSRTCPYDTTKDFAYLACAGRRPS